MMDNKTKIFIAFPLVLIIIFILIANSIPFWVDEGLLHSLKGELSEGEMQVLELAPADVMKRVNREIREPLESFVQGSFSQMAPEALAPDFPIKEGLSLIVVSERSRMAIIKGIVVKEGDTIEGVKVAKIEPKRVLLKNKTSHWLNMEERR